MLTLVIQVNSDLSTIFVSRWNFLHPYPLPFLLSYLVGSLAEFKRRFKKNLLYLKKSQGSEIANLSKICLFCRCFSLKNLNDTKGFIYLFNVLKFIRSELIQPKQYHNLKISREKTLNCDDEMMVKYGE